MFDHTCNFRIPADGLDPEELELELIDLVLKKFLKMKTLIYGAFMFWNHPKRT
jgi:hypothetical protein